MRTIKTALIAAAGLLVPFATVSAQAKRAISVPTLSWPGMLIMGAVLGVTGLVVRLRRR